MVPPHKPPTVNQDVLDALYRIRTTPYPSSFLSRTLGFGFNAGPGLIACDWDTKPLWIELMDDIQEHHSFRQ